MKRDPVVNEVDLICLIMQCQCLSVSVCLFVCLSACAHVCMPTYLPVCLSVCLQNSKVPDKHMTTFLSIIHIAYPWFMENTDGIHVINTAWLPWHPLQFCMQRLILLFYSSAFGSHRDGTKDWAWRLVPNSDVSNERKENVQQTADCCLVREGCAS